MRRLFVPWAGDRWPQQTHLALSDAGTTLKIARGDSFTLSVKVRPGDRIPESARVTYASPTARKITEPLRPAEGGEFRGRIETVNSAVSVLGRRRATTSARSATSRSRWFLRPLSIGSRSG